MKPVIVTISDPKLAKCLGAKELLPIRRDLVAAKANDIIFVCNGQAYSWPLHRSIVLETTLIEAVKKFTDAAAIPAKKQIAKRKPDQV